ncbi:hypothetical protein [Sulfurimonas sp.]|uniref:hypothetical protein n=1 Tax=Sulfurimonas sp. TaxID=2022749 RepID=UPI002604B31C|nr:hypothetical protein [Sulfurimonas sp.]MDD3450941.1 hypothetical protein [Sulfurimonas sp.]
MNNRKNRSEKMLGQAAQLTVVNKLINEIESSRGSENLKFLTREIRQVYKLKRKIEKNKFNVNYTKDVKKVAISINSELSK